MAGIYIHIPFCKKRCTYCDFYTEVAPNLVSKMVDTLVQELEIRQNYLNRDIIETIYFGGGTPSLLSNDQFKTIFDAIYARFEVSKDAEITFEANPDDLSIEFLSSISVLPFNRISVGIQSFDDDDLKRLNRRHNSRQAVEAIMNVQNAGIKNVSVDLIYGLPSQTLEAWKSQLARALNLNIQHISAYGLTYEENTVLWKQRENGEIYTVDDETMNEMYDYLLQATAEKGFLAYEISNFSLPNFQSKHNQSYWQQIPYLGIGPSAHSYDIYSRQWNVSSITQYIAGIEKGEPYFDLEKLSRNDRYNDYIMTALRTSNGIDLNFVEQQFGAEMKEYCLNSCNKYLIDNKICRIIDKLSLTKEGIIISNIILTDLMIV